MVGGLVAIFYFPIYWVANHPNWRNHIFQSGPTTNQYFSWHQTSTNLWLAGGRGNLWWVHHVSGFASGRLNLNTGFPIEISHRYFPWKSMEKSKSFPLEPIRWCWCFWTWTSFRWSWISLMSGDDLPMKSCRSHIDVGMLKNPHVLIEKSYELFQCRHHTTFTLFFLIPVEIPSKVQMCFLLQSSLSLVKPPYFP